MRHSHEKLSGLMTLLVFGIFAVCILLVLLTGAEIYRKIVDRQDETYTQRTAAQYITTRVRQADTADGLTVEAFGDTAALVLREEIDGDIYLTRIYWYNGYLCELFSEETGDFLPEDGENVFSCAPIEFTYQSPVLSVRIGDTQTLTLMLRAETEGEYAE